MALQTKSIVGDGSRKHHRFTLKITEESTDIGANTSKISFSFVLAYIPPYTGWDWAHSGTVPVTYTITINGTQYSGNIMKYDGVSTVTVKTGTLTVGHNDDGNKTLSFSFKVSSLSANYLPGDASASGTMSLTYIPRSATITSAADFTDTGTPSLTFSNPGNFPLDVWLEPNIDAIHLCIRKDISGTSGTYEWHLTDEERDQLRSKCASTECTIRYGLHTTIGNTVSSDYEDKKFKMTENEATKPTVSMGVSLNNGNLSSAFDGLYIQGKSKVDVTLSAEGKYGATIKSYSTVVDGKTYSSDKFTSDVVQNPGSVKITGYAKDSRGFTGSAEETINVMEYSKPLVVSLASENAILCYRSDGNGKRVGNSTSVWVKAKRSYYGLGGKNTCALQYRFKPVNDEWNDSIHEWLDLIPGAVTADGYDALIPDEVFDLKTAYTVQVMAKDDIGESDIKTFEIPTQDVALHLGKGGKNVAVGTYCDYSEEHTFYSEWKAIFDKDVVIGGDVLIGQTTLKDYILNVINGG